MPKGTLSLTLAAICTVVSSGYPIIKDCDNYSMWCLNYVTVLLQLFACVTVNGYLWHLIIAHLQAKGLQVGGGDDGGPCLEVSALGQIVN